ncbi:MAG: Ser-Thr-rich GPI-anchored membrane family protein, partial [Candidatus Eisenbacteria bacterium]
GNSYGHPTGGALGRLHTAGVKTYWTETGAGAAPNAAWDKVSNGQVIISATWEAGGVDTVRGTGFADTFTNSGTPAGDVTAPLVTLASPDGGEVWKVGSSHSITWTATDDVGVTALDLAWSTTGAAPWSPIASGVANSGAFAWTVPAEPSTLARVRVVARDAAGNSSADSSLAAFTVDYWTIVASAGAGGSITPSGEIPVDQGAGRSFTIAPGPGWQVADVVVDGASVGAIGAYGFTAVAANHTIAASFLDIADPVVSVTSPSGGEIWSPGSVYDITWTASDNQSVDSVTVQYSTDGPGGPWSTIAHGLANSGSYAWTVPPISADSARVRVLAYDPALRSRAAISAAPFRIGASSVAVGNDGPASLALANPIPNPSSGSAWLHFSLPRDGHMRLEILDLSGRRVWHAEGRMAAGPHLWRWDGRAANGGRAEAGHYFVRLTTPWGTRTARLTRLL